MKPDIRKETGLIIGNGSEFLIGRCIVTKQLRWSISPYDAWKTRIRAQALSVAEKTGCEVFLFNPVVGQLRRYTGG